MSGTTCLLFIVVFLLWQELFRSHVRQHFRDLPEDIDDERVEEEYRKAVFQLEEEHGPFAVQGQEIRRCVSNYSRHFTHSYPGSESVGFQTQLRDGQARDLRSCAVCGMSHCLEDLIDLHLFVAPHDDAADTGQCSESEDEDDNDQATVNRNGRKSFSIHPEAIQQIDDLLSATIYQARWPLIPWHELEGSSVAHPYLPSMRWLLNTKVLDEPLQTTPTETLQSGDAPPPPIPSCMDCARSLCRRKPQMPKYALANDNLMPRESRAWRTNGRRLSPLAVQMLSLARASVRKVIAEPNKPKPQEEKQKGFRSNTIAFPQAVCKQLITSSLPASASSMGEYLQDTLSVVLCGVDPQDLQHAKEFQVCKSDYEKAVRFLIAHCPQYSKLNFDEAAASTEFAAKVPASLSTATVIMEDCSKASWQEQGPANAGDGHAEEPATRECEDIEPEENEIPSCQWTAESTASSDLDPLRAVEELAAKLELLQRLFQSSDGSQTTIEREIVSIQDLAKKMGQERYLRELHRLLGEAESSSDSVGQYNSTLEGDRVVIPRGSKPLSYYTSDFWVMCFPDKFSYGDGVFGLRRRRPLTFHQWCYMILLRTELQYKAIPKPASCPLVSQGFPACAQCSPEAASYAPPSQPRWSSDLDLMCVLYDSWRRMELVKKASLFVRRKGFQVNLRLVAETTSAAIRAVIEQLGPQAGMRDIIAHSGTDPSLKQALSDLLIFSGDVVGTDGSRQLKRHEIQGTILRYGPLGAFLTANVADARNPLFVKFHGGSNGVHAGVDPNGLEEQITISLLDDCPCMPRLDQVLRFIAGNPVAQARYFILATRLFLEHIMGAGPFDQLLRHNGSKDGVAHPDGYAANGVAGGMNMIAALHMPVEEQARLSIHGHAEVWFINRMSQQWFRRMINGNTTESRDRIRLWQTKLVEAVESLQTTAVCTTPLLFADTPMGAVPFSHPHYTSQWQKEDGFDGGLENDAKDPDRRRITVDMISKPLDLHMTAARVDSTNSSPMQSRFLPLTGACLSSLPHWRLLPEKDVTCNCAGCSTRFNQFLHMQTCQEAELADARAYAENFSKDATRIVGLTSLHRHTDTCFKYVTEGERRKPQHCRFGYVHYVRVWVEQQIKRGNRIVTQLVEKIIPRTGKEPVLPQGSQSEPGTSVLLENHMFQPASLGASVSCDDQEGSRFRVCTVRGNPREGSTLMAGICAHRGNLDYQDTRTTLSDGYNRNAVDLLRCSSDELASAQELQLPPLLRYSADANHSVFYLLAKLLLQKPPVKVAIGVIEYLCTADVRALNVCCLQMAREIIPRTGVMDTRRIGDRFADRLAQSFATKIVKCMIEGVRNATQLSFYICDYATKPNMLCGSLLQHMSGGIAKLEAELQRQSNLEALERLQAQNAVDECKNAATASTSAADPIQSAAASTAPDGIASQQKARKVLIRLWSSANHALVKGCCLQAFQLLTRREAVVTHKYWRILTKRLIWSAWEAVRVYETGLRADIGAQDLRMESIAIEPQGGVTISLANHAFYDDWLHRGSEEPLKSMPHYCYAQYVVVEPRTQQTLFSGHVFEFDSHYQKSTAYIQRLLYAPRIPFISGFTMPTKTIDPSTNALFHNVLLQPTRCLSAKHCSDHCQHSAPYFWRNAAQDPLPQRLHGFAQPIRQKTDPTGARRFESSWRAWEAHVQTLVRSRADPKLRQAQRVATLTDVTDLREWWMPGAARNTALQLWLLPWLQGASIAQCRVECSTNYADPTAYLKTSFLFFVRHQL